MERAVKILVVEDDFFTALELTEHLVRHGFHVMGPAGSLGTASSLLAHRKPDLVLLDINLGNDGLAYHFAENLRKLDVPFVFITGYDQELVAEKGFAATPVMLKPVDLAAVVEQVQLFCR